MIVSESRNKNTVLFLIIMTFQKRADGFSKAVLLKFKMFSFQKTKTKPKMVKTLKISTLNIPKINRS